MKQDINNLLNQICIVNTKQTSFCSRLVAIEGDELWFQSKNLMKTMVRWDHVVLIRPLHPKKEEVA